jgi:hypothetical protein
MQQNSMTHWSSIPKLIMDYPWTKDIEDITNLYNVDEKVGLSEERVRLDFHRYGPNGNSIIHI